MQSSRGVTLTDLDGNLAYDLTGASAAVEVVQVTAGSANTQFALVLNAANTDTSAANVAGFRVDANGSLTSIPGSIRPLSTDHPNPAQVLLDPERRILLVTEKRTNLIDVTVELAC